jgi:hypothetical protein
MVNQEPVATRLRRHHPVQVPILTVVAGEAAAD